ncbi:MAG: GIY-YIG nuclease family protein [Salinisphaeraceae bacterium]|nr:GIY-YIG nuclease family protein [Salinisphaeraceae bacterium]
MPDLHPDLRDAVSRLPNSPGVYLFYRDKTPLYIGKSIHLKQRVQSHIVAARRGGKEQRFVSAATRIEHELRPNELSALLRENALIKQLRPLYNKRLRRKRDVWSWQIDKVNPAEPPQLITHQWPPTHDTLQWGLYRNRTQAHEALRTLCREECLCEQAVGLSHNKGPCFQFQLKRCKGVCAGMEMPHAHAERLLKAFKARAFNIWPYDGAVGLRLAPPSPALSVIDRWHYYGDFDSVAHAKQVMKAHPLTPNILDLDAFRIVVAYLYRHGQDQQKIIAI